MDLVGLDVVILEVAEVFGRFVKYASKQRTHQKEEVVFIVIEFLRGMLTVCMVVVVCNRKCSDQWSGCDVIIIKIMNNANRPPARTINIVGEICDQKPCLQ